MQNDEAEQHMSIVAIRGAAKSYRLGKVEVHALRGVSLEVQAGEFIWPVALERAQRSP